MARLSIFVCVVIMNSIKVEQLKLSPIESRIEFAELASYQREALLEAYSRLAGAYAPQTLNHRGAAIVARLPDESLVYAYGNNADSSMRTKSCAEKNAIPSLRIQAPPETRLIIDSILTISERQTSDAPVEPPVAPCGTCRSQLFSYAAFEGHDLSRAFVVMASSDFQDIRRAYLRDLFPLPDISSLVMRLRGEGSEQFSVHRHKEALNDLICPVPQRFGNQELDWLRSGAIAALQRATSHGGRVGAAILVADNMMLTGQSLGLDPITGGMSAIVSAIVRAQSERAVRHFKAVYVVTDGNDTSCAQFLTGDDRQMIFDRAQIMDWDVPVFMGSTQTDRVVRANISQLFPIAEGPLDSSSTRANIGRYLS